MPAAQLEIADLSAGYGQTRVLENVSFAVPAGQTVATPMARTLAGPQNWVCVRYLRRQKQIPLNSCQTPHPSHS